MFEAFAVGALVPIAALTRALVKEDEAALSAFFLSLTIWHMAAILAILWRLQ